MLKKDVKKNLLNHSEAKVNLLGEYINRYLNIICNDGFTNEINIYDLFCGEGIYDGGGEGSPLVIMKAVKNVYYQNVAKRTLKTKINCFFNDIDSQKVDKTKISIADKSLYYNTFGTINFSSIDYKDYLSNLIGDLIKLRNQKRFVFLDPYEYKHIKISHIKQLMVDKKTEVLLWLPTQFMYRFEKNGTPTALKDFIEELIPSYNQWNQSDNVWVFIEELKNAFQNSMGENYFVDNFTIQKDRNAVFCLYFFTSHIKGFEKMLESKWKIDTEQGKGWDYSTDSLQVSLFSEQKINPLAEKLDQYLRTSNRTNGDIFEFTLRQGFLPTHTNEIFKDWQNIGKLEVTLEDGNKARKNSFYIRYDYYKTKEDYSKVTFRIK